jgi:hypothetical protein
METTRPASAGTGAENTPHFVDDAGPEDVRAWEEIESGRFMPRRIKGSCVGRALG